MNLSIDFGNSPIGGNLANDYQQENRSKPILLLVVITLSILALIVLFSRMKIAK